MKQLITLFISGFVMFSCINKVDKINDAAINKKDPLPVIKIDFEEVKSNLAEKLSDVYEPVEIIPLETNKESLLGNFRDLKFYRDKIYILNTSFNGDGLLKVFSRSGKYQHHVGQNGKGPGEYNQPLDFDVFNDKIWILERNKLLEFNLEGIFQSEIPLDFTAEKFACVSENYFVFYGSGQEDRIIITDNRGQIIKSAIKSTPKNNASTPWLIQTVDSMAFFNIPLCDTVFAFSNDSLYTYCKVDFGSFAFTNEVYEKLPKEAQLAPFTSIPYTDKYVVNQMFMETQDYFFSLMMNGTKFIHEIVSKHDDTNKYYHELECEDDIWHAKVPGLPIQYLDQNKVVFFQNAIQILDGWKYLKEKSKLSGLTEQEQVVFEQMNRTCEGLDEMSNPLLFVAKVKN